jgi:hypothetical protein
LQEDLALANSADLTVVVEVRTWLELEWRRDSEVSPIEFDEQSLVCSRVNCVRKLIDFGVARAKGVQMFNMDRGASFHRRSYVAYKASLK